MIQLQILQKKNFLKSITGRDYFNYITSNLKFYLKDIFPKNIKVKNYNFEILFKINNIKYLISNLNTNTINTICKHTFNIQILLPIVLKSYQFNKYYLLNIILLEFPFINIHGILLLNGIQRILLSKLTRSEGLYYTSYIKENYIIYQIQIISEISVCPISIILDINSFNILIEIDYLNIKINLISFLYLLGIYNKYILLHSFYGNTFIIKNILYKGILNYFQIVNKDINYIKKILVLIKTLMSFYKLKLFKINGWTLIYSNFIYIIDSLLNISFNKTYLKDKDHFGNKLITFFSDNFKNYFTIKILNFLNILSTININTITNKNIIHTNNTYLYKEVLLINPLLRILDDTNLVSEFSNSLKILNSGIITLSSINTAPLYLRDIRFNQLGKFCIVDTGEGPSSGLILSLTLNTFNVRSNKYLKSFFYTKQYSKILENIITVDIKEQESYSIVLEDSPLKKEVLFNIFIIPCIINSTFNTVPIKYSTILYTTLEHFMSSSENLIPFVFNNEPIRCLMGAKMQTQSLPLLYKKHSLILSGYEYSINNLYFETIRALQEGVVSYVSFYKIIIRDILNRNVTYYLPTYISSNNKIFKYQKPIVWIGERVSIGQILTETCSSKNDILTLGNPSLVLYGSYFGYDYEDSLIISQNIIYNNIYTSLHIDVYESLFNYSDSSVEYSTLNIPDYSLFKQRNLNILGLIKEGSKIIEGDVLISKVLKKELNLSINTTIINLILKLFGTSLLNNINVSENVSKGNSGRVLKVELLITEISNKMYLKLRIFIGKIRVIDSGDKLCGRHGNKGIISYISKNIDLPYIITGECPNIITGSLGVPSRMNLGQLYEGLLGLSCFYLDKKLIVTSLIDSITGNNYLKLFLYDLLYKTSIKTSFNKIYNPYTPGKIIIRDGRSGSFLKGSVCFGMLQYYKLIHMIKDKINYRTTGKYNNITQQPPRGRSDGGQRFGEMEIWALEAFGTAYTLREVLSYRSDDMLARENLFNAIISGKDIITSTSISETLKITIKELQSLSIDIGMFLIYPNLIENKFNSKIY